MKRALLDISGKLDSITIGIYELIRDVAAANNIKFFIIGATARDLVLHHGYEIEIRRATRDIDLAIQVSDWGQFLQLKKSLLGTGNFSETNQTQRLLNTNGVPIDIVPFGAIKQQNGSISWPPENAVIMNVLGFDEALEDAVPVKLNSNPDLEILVASPTSLAALKLIAWQDRPNERSRDAIDINIIVNNYLNIGNNERLYQENKDLIDSNFEYVEAGARLLGRDIASRMSQETISYIVRILEEQTAENSQHLLIEHMINRGEEGPQFDLALRNIIAIREGVKDVKK